MCAHAVVIVYVGFVSLRKKFLIINSSHFAEHKQLLHEAKICLKRSKRKDYYKILGVVKSASEEEIKKAYKKRALIHHPGNDSRHWLCCTPAHKKCAISLVSMNVKEAWFK